MVCYMAFVQAVVVGSAGVQGQILKSIPFICTYIVCGLSLYVVCAIYQLVPQLENRNSFYPVILSTSSSDGEVEDQNLRL